MVRPHPHKLREAVYDWPEMIRRALERDPGQRALHMTGHPDVQFDAEAGVPGHVPVIRKPFNPEQLIEAVQNSLAAPPPTGV